VVAAVVAVTLVVIGKLSPNPAVAVLTPLGVLFCVLAVVFAARIRR
jgi:hypothetical protein